MAIVVLIAAFTISKREPPPPTIAEFAPQAQEQIREAPNEQSFGEAGGPGDPRGEGGENPAFATEEEEAIDVPRVRRCVGDPPRQTEDPQSPPCVPYWSGENGGETSRGVTANEIIVALPFVFFEDLGAIRDLANHVNKRYELYGRKIVLKEYTPRGNISSHPNIEQEHADAQQVDQEIGAFASLSTGLRWGQEHHYYDELARRKILSVAHGAGGQLTEERLKEFAPYQWAVLPGMDTMLRNYAEFVCNGLAKKPPRFAGAKEQLETERVFGLIYQRTTDGNTPDISPLEDGLDRCGVTLKVKLEDNPSADTGRNAGNLMIQMSGEGVTSIICLCQCNDVRDHMMPASSGQGYFPEWLLSTYINNDVDNCHRTSPPDQSRSIIGLTFGNKHLLREDMPWYWALKEVNSSYNPGEGSYYHLSARYASLLLLASGIQMAGPNLTPETFAAALQKTRFPNPGAGLAPYYQARVGFEGGKHTMIGDAGMFWYDAAAQSAIEPSQVGAVCFVDLGLRYRLGRWPKEEPRFRQGPCY
ncbi:MAG TPA: hypothetical protein VND22_04515 [Actinomycetota bacterium]|nr:hypothetical protein [Actinomycetota bacterium]